MKKQNSDQKKRKAFKITIIGIIIIIIGVLGYITADRIINHDKTATIKILVAPTTATVKINGTDYPTQGEFKIKPDFYDVTIEKDGFIPFTGKIEAKDSEVTYIYKYLEPADGNEKYYEDNEQDYQIIQQINDFEADLTQATFVNSDPIWSVTPFYSYNEGVKIIAEEGTDKKITINIYLLTCRDDKVEELKNNANKYLIKNKINLKNYQVKYSKLC